MAVGISMISGAKSWRNIVKDSCDIARQYCFQALEKLYRSGRFPHAILLVSDAVALADGIVDHFANKFLNCEDCRKHIDFFTMKPGDCGDQIVAEDIRQLIANVRASPRIGKTKVAYVSHADAMNKYAANAFLMTLEEPPGDTIIFLSVANKYDLLPTILSRCIAFEMHQKVEHVSAILERIANMYESWLNALNSKKNFNLAVMEMYRILSFVDSNFDKFVDELGLSKSEAVKILVGKLERIANKFFRENAKIVAKLHVVVGSFEENKYFLSLNCNVVAYLEVCFIITLRFFKNLMRDS
jgi:DNA polymerase-3 subunit delta'